jgi:hypothetical protein
MENVPVPELPGVSKIRQKFDNFMTHARCASRYLANEIDQPGT